MIHPRGKDKVVAVIEAYCDESGINRDDKYCAVVGFLATARHWQQFEEAWAKASRGITFHGKRFFARAAPGGQRLDEYAGWSNDRAEQYISALASAICDARLSPIGAVIDIGAFQTLGIQERRYLTGMSYDTDTGRTLKHTGNPDKPYFLGFSHCLLDAVGLVHKGKYKVSFVFDQQPELAGYALQYYQRVLSMTEARLNMGGLIFKDKEGIGGLQAADLLAHACTRRFRTPVGVHREFDVATKLLAPITDKRIRFIEGKSLRESLDRAPDVLKRKWI